MRMTPEDPSCLVSAGILQADFEPQDTKPELTARFTTAGFPRPAAPDDPGCLVTIGALESGFKTPPREKDESSSKLGAAWLTSLLNDMSDEDRMTTLDTWAQEELASVNQIIEPASVAPTRAPVVA